MDDTDTSGGVACEDDDGGNGGVYQDEEYEVARLLAHHQTSGADKFLVDWAGCPDAMWELTSELLLGLIHE